MTIFGRGGSSPPLCTSLRSGSAQAEPEGGFSIRLPAWLRGGFQIRPPDGLLGAPWPLCYRSLPMPLLFATRNADKLREIRAELAIPGLIIESALDYPDAPEVVEDGDTLEANAIKKAVSLARHFQCWTLADDTGLEVEALDGAPGIYAGRYAGPEATYAENLHKLLAAMSGRRNRRARFRTVIALADPLGNARTVDGVCPGRITDSARGGDGFGYDPVFEPEGETRTFAEMSLAEKNRCSHRARALRAARDAWGAELARLAEG